MVGGNPDPSTKMESWFGSAGKARGPITKKPTDRPFGKQMAFLQHKTNCFGVVIFPCFGPGWSGCRVFGGVKISAGTSAHASANATKNWSLDFFTGVDASVSRCTGVSGVPPFADTNLPVEESRLDFCTGFCFTWSTYFFFVSSGSNGSCHFFQPILRMTWSFCCLLSNCFILVKKKETWKSLNLHINKTLARSLYSIQKHPCHADNFCSSTHLQLKTFASQNICNSKLLELKTFGTQNFWNSKLLQLKTCGTQNFLTSKLLQLKTFGTQDVCSSKTFAT